MTTKSTKFWQVSIYQTYREFGGHEEGGWYYTAGHAVNCFPRRFNSWTSARDFINSISDKIAKTSKNQLGEPTVSNAYTQLAPRIWYKGKGPEELPTPYYC